MRTTRKLEWSATAYVFGTAGTPAALTGTTEVFSTDIDLESKGYEGAIVWVEAHFQDTPTEDVEARIYSSPDGSAGSYDDTELSPMTLAKETDPHQIPFQVKNYPHLRIGLKQTGASDSQTAKVFYRAWRVVMQTY